MHLVDLWSECTIDLLLKNTLLQKHNLEAYFGENFKHEKYIWLYHTLRCA